MESPTTNSTKSLKYYKRKRPNRWIIRCSACHEIITKNDALTNNVISCLKRFWHRSHFNCAKCSVAIGVDERDFRTDPNNEHRPLCIDCFMDDFHPPCEVCGKPLRETCVIAMEKRMHKCCFACMRCGSPFPDGEFVMLNGMMYDEDCYFSEKAKAYAITRSTV